MEAILMEHTFYGDIFIINNKGCLFMGSGKSKAGRTAADENRENEVTCDFAGIFKSNNIIYGHFSVPNDVKSEPMFENIIAKAKNNKVAVEYVFYCLDSEMTNAVYRDATKFDLIEVSRNKFIDVAQGHISFTSTDTIDALLEFKTITENSNLRYFFVPWCISHEEKGNLIKNYIAKLSKGEKI